MASAHSAETTAKPDSNGLALAIGAYVIWGVLPLYLRFVQSVPPLEFVGWRVIFTLPICLLLVAVYRLGGELLAVLRQPRHVAALVCSALLVGANWVIYVAAVHDGHVLAASIGYYINPLVNVLLGTTFLGERLSRTRWLAVAVATCGVAILAIEALDALWLSLAMTLTFGGYGLVRKVVPVGAVVGLTWETIVLLPAGLAIIAWQAGQPGGTSIGGDVAGTALIVMFGPITAIPLMMFAAATRRMDYATIGFIQFLSPTLTFIQGIWVFKEPLGTDQLACFLLIWCACGIYSWDLLRRRPRPATA